MDKLVAANHLSDEDRLFLSRDRLPVHQAPVDMVEGAGIALRNGKTPHRETLHCLCAARMIVDAPVATELLDARGQYLYLEAGLVQMAGGMETYCLRTPGDIRAKPGNHKSQFHGVFPEPWTTGSRSRSDSFTCIVPG